MAVLGQLLLILVYVHLQVSNCEAQFCKGVSDNFTTFDDLRAASGPVVIPLPDDSLEFMAWIFPNNLRFPCAGQVAKWIFRVPTPINRTGLIVPQWTIFHENTGTLSNTDYLVRSRSGSLGELSNLEGDIFQYILNTPVAVEEGDILGIAYGMSEGSNFLQVLFMNEFPSPLSYRSNRPLSSPILDLRFTRFTTADDRFVPLVIPVMVSNSSSSVAPTMIVAPAPTPTPANKATPQLLPTASSNAMSLIPISSREESASPSFQVTQTPSSSNPPTPTTTATITTEPQITSEPPRQTSEPPSPSPTSTPLLSIPDTTTPESFPTTNPQTSTSTTEPPPMSPAIVVGAVAGILCVVVLVVAVMILVLFCMRKKRQKFKVSTSELISPLENPVYQVSPGALEDEKKKTEDLRIYDSVTEDMQFMSASQQPNGHSHMEQQGPGLNGHTHRNGVGMGRVTQSNLDYEMPEVSVQQYQQHQLNSSSAYHEVVVASLTEEEDRGKGEPQDYALPVVSASKQSTMEMQPYEVPMESLSSHLSSQVKPKGEEGSTTTTSHYYNILDGGIYVPTEIERELYLPRPESSASVSPSRLDESIYSRMSQKYKDKPQKASFFEEEDIYWAPASSKTALYDQLASRKYREILRPQIEIIKHLGSGQFGTVNMGYWRQAGESIEVAVKMLMPQSTDEDKVKFLQEAAIMGQFLHPHVVKLYGVVTMGDPIMIVLENMQKGDLKKHLLTLQPKPGEIADSNLPHLLLKFCRDIASGMNYLSNKSFVHRDLAARNVLIGSDDTCKIGDFGMSRDLQDNNYYITHGGKIPVKWTAPEALNFRKYSTASDVWSFGAVMYETWSLGRKPFDEYTNSQTIELIGRGYRMPPPPGCPRALYELMIRCWHFDAIRRPVFSAIVKMLSHSDLQLLSWNSKDLSVHPHISCLGAPKEVGDELYQDLQDYYLNRPNQT